MMLLLTFQKRRKMLGRKKFLPRENEERNDCWRHANDSFAVFLIIGEKGWKNSNCFVSQRCLSFSRNALFCLSLHADLLRWLSYVLTFSERFTTDTFISEKIITGKIITDKIITDFSIGTVITHTVMAQTVIAHTVINHTVTCNKHS